jgi:RNA polymerase sigma-70 factor (ECF subfamily)
MLVARLKRGDMRALEELYRLFEQPVYALAWRMLNDRDEAREILHDVMIAVYEKRAQFRGDSPFWGWLRQIAVNESLMRLRKRRIDYVDELPEPESAGAALPVAANQQDLERALSALPELTRSVVWLYHVEGYSHEEIAASFDKSVSFSKSQVSRGTSRLRSLLHTGTEQLAYA